MFGPMTPREIAETYRSFGEAALRQQPAEDGHDASKVARTSPATNPQRKEDQMGTHTRGTARLQWEQAIEAKQVQASQLGKPITRDAATKAVVHERPDLHRAMIDEANQARSRRG